MTNLHADCIDAYEADMYGNDPEPLDFSEARPRTYIRYGEMYHEDMEEMQRLWENGFCDLPEEM